jgi:hypothetical protein
MGSFARWHLVPIVPISHEPPEDLSEPQAT